MTTTVMLMSRESIHTEILQRLTLSLSVFVCVCMCMCVRACIQYNMNMLQIPATTESCPGQELKNQVRPCGLAMQCDRPRFDIRHCSSNHFWHSEHGKAGRLSFCFSACFSFLFAPRVTPLIRLDLNVHDLPKLCARQMVLSALLFPCLWNLRCVARCGTSRFSRALSFFDALDSEPMDPN